MKIKAKVEVMSLNKKGATSQGVQVERQGNRFSPKASRRNQSADV